MLILEKERNLDLKKLLDLERKKNEDLTNDIIKIGKSCESFKSANIVLREKYDSLNETHKSLEV